MIFVFSVKLLFGAHVGVCLHFYVVFVTCIPSPATRRVASPGDFHFRRFSCDM